jgi:crotonobetainyl-CoA:carnitine CoA-transferase CaiB-like acyl-CoA transferase
VKTFHELKGIMDANVDNGLPLSGVTVVELCHSVAGPYAASILADLGADVIKVETPGKGDYGRDWGPPFAHGTSTLFHVLNHNKRGVALDLRDRVTCDRLKALILERADVVIQNMRPGAID